MKSDLRIMISGGGTGGHIFPALSIADELMKKYPTAKIEFVGANDRMEMQKIPEAGYKIHGITISGIQRADWKKNITFPIKLWKSLLKCKKLIREFKPDVVIGTGGFASGPLLWAAQLKKIPTVIQEQNSYPGITNKLLSKKAKTICVAYSGLDKWFPQRSIVFTGNPVRKSLLELGDESKGAKEALGFNPDKKVILVLGGSLGARAINKAVKESYSEWIQAGYQVVWQCGKVYYNALMEEVPQIDGLLLTDFVKDMNVVYSAADVIISRAGAGTLSELAIVGKPAILIPSPNVAEDHQTKNARAFSEKGAAVLLPEKNAEELKHRVLDLLENQEDRTLLEKEIKKLAKPYATEAIVTEIEKQL